MDDKDVAYGDLQVSKTVKGKAADKTKAFHFTVSLSDTDINGTYGDMTFTDGEASFTLKHGESKTAEKLPEGVSYTVTEDDYSSYGYTTICTGETGSIIKNTLQKAVFINTKDTPLSTPKTGDSTNIMLWVLLAAGSFLVMITSLLFRRR